MEWTKRLGMDDRFTERYLNEGFSGGEKKRNEILQMALMEPDFAVLDETDSGLDIDALRDVAARHQRGARRDRPELGILLITHYQRILEHLTPDVVHVLLDGRIVASGGPELARRIEAEGFDAFRAGGGGMMGTRTLDVARIKADFPILKREVNGKRLVYLDSASSSQKPTAVLDAMDEHYRTYYANIHRGVYTIAEESTAAYEAARGEGRPLRRCAERERGRVHQEHHRGDQPRRVLVGPHQPPRGRRDRRSPRWSTTPTSCRGTSSPPSAASSCAGSRSPTTTASTSPTSTSCSTAPSCFAFTAMSNVLGTINDVRAARRRRPRRRRARARRRRAGRAARPVDVAGLGRRLRRVHRPQDARPERHRRLLGPRPSCSRRCRRSSAAAR